MYFGWKILLTLSFTEIMSWGIVYYSYAVFLLPMEHELGWSRAQSTGPFSAALLVSAVTSIPFGRWLDRYGPRYLMTIGSCVAALLVFAWSRVHSLAALYVIWIGMGITMTAILSDPAFFVVARWFERERAKAFTVLAFFAALASPIFMPLETWLIRQQGWREALITLAVLLAVMTILPHALLLRRGPEELGLLPDGELPAQEGTPLRGQEPSMTRHAAMCSPALWWITTAFLLSQLSVAAVTTHVIPYWVERGHSVPVAAAATGAIGFMQIAGRLAFSPLRKILPRQFVTMSLFFLQGLALIVLLTMHSAWNMWIFVSIFGIANGMITLLRASVITDYFGPAHYGSISGLVSFWVSGARAVAPVAVGGLFTWIGHYEPVFWGLAASAFFAGGSAWLSERWAHRLVEEHVS